MSAFDSESEILAFAEVRGFAFFKHRCGCRKKDKHYVTFCQGIQGGFCRVSFISSILN